jgi:hypothetical protein
MSKRAGNNLSSVLNVGDITNRARVFRDAVGGKERSVFYSFQLNRSSNFSLRLDRLRANANVRLMNGQGKMMMQSARPKRQPEVINTVLGAGTYHIRVFPARRSDQTRYQLRLSAIELSPRTPERPAGVICRIVGNGMQICNTGGTASSEPQRRANSATRLPSGSQLFTIRRTGGTANPHPINARRVISSTRPPFGSQVLTIRRTGGTANPHPINARRSSFATRVPLTGILSNDIVKSRSTNSNTRGAKGLDTFIGDRGVYRLGLGDDSNLYY